MKVAVNMEHVDEGKESSNSVLFFNTYVVDDVEEFRIIGDTAKDKIHRTLHIFMKYPEIPIALYMLCFEAIFEYLKEQEKTKDSLKLILANRFEIGFTTSFDTEEERDFEKFGNYAIYMKHYENDKQLEMEYDDDASAVSRCTQWNEANITRSSVDAVKDITTKTIKKWADVLDMPVSSAEVVMPIFMMVHESIVNYLRVDLGSHPTEFEKSLSLGGCYEIYCRRMENGLDISFKPAVSDKVFMKDDGRATSKYE